LVFTPANIFPRVGSYPRRTSARWIYRTWKGRSCSRKGHGGRLACRYSHAVASAAERQARGFETEPDDGLRGQLPTCLSSRYTGRAVPTIDAGLRPGLAVYNTWIRAVLCCGAPTSALQQGPNTSFGTSRVPRGEDRRQALVRTRVKITNAVKPHPVSWRAWFGQLFASIRSSDTETFFSFDDFINRIRGEDAEPPVISGRFPLAKGASRDRWGGRHSRATRRGTDAR